MSFKIGILLPMSVIYPSISFDLVAGLRIGLADQGITNIEIKTVNIGIAGNDKQIYAQCEQLLMEGVNIITGYINPMTAEKLAPLFANGNALFISLDAGYHYPTSLNKLRHVFYISLQGALCCRVIAKMAFNEGMKKIAYTSSYYEAGYRSAYTFYKCLEDEGGQITFNHITKLKRAEFTLAPLDDHLKTADVDAVFASFCGDMLQDFYTTAARNSTFAHHPVYGAPFMGEEQWLDQCPYPGVDIKVCVPWAKELNNAENKNFADNIIQKKQRMNIFSLLGWEAGTVIAATLSTEDIGEAINRLEGYTFQSPRGNVYLSAETHQCHVPVYEAMVQKNEQTGNCQLAPGKESPFTDDQRQRLEKDIRNVNGPFTSWLNAYACLES